MSGTANFHLDWWITAADRCPIAVAFIDAKGEYAWTNPAFSKLLGWSRTEILGKHWSEITPLAEIGEGQETERKTRLGEQTEIYETKTLRTKAGLETLVSIYAHRFPPYGDFQGWIMFLTDATATKDSVDKLRDQYNRIKGQIDLMQTTSQNCQASCAEKIEETRDKQEEMAVELRNLTNHLLNRSGDGNKVSIGGDYSGRDKTNTPTVVLMWVIIAAVCLGVASMGSRLIIRMQEHGPNVTVEP